MFNKIILVGNLTRDIELRYTNGGTALAKTAIATTRKFSTNGEKKEEVCFVDITFFGRSAEVANQYLRKGSKCLVEGRLMFEQWTDQQGQKRSKHSVTVESMQMLDSKSDSQNGGGYNAPAQNDNQGMTQSFGGSEAYNAPVQPQTQYQPPQQQQQSMQQPKAQQQTAYQGGQQQGGYNPLPAQPNYQPQTTIPEIDIDEDEIPF
jgi:single-strand DNA-binding protein